MALDDTVEFINDSIRLLIFAILPAALLCRALIASQNVLGKTRYAFWHRD